MSDKKRYIDPDRKAKVGYVDSADKTEQGAYHSAFRKMEDAYLGLNKPAKIKKWKGPTSAFGDFIYFAAWLITGAAILSTFSMMLFTEGFVLCVFGPLTLLATRSLMKIAGYLKRIESLLSAAMPAE